MSLTTIYAWYKLHLDDNILFMATICNCGYLHKLMTVCLNVTIYVSTRTRCCIAFVIHVLLVLCCTDDNKISPMFLFSFTTERTFQILSPGFAFEILAPSLEARGVFKIVVCFLHHGNSKCFLQVHFVSFDFPCLKN